jgi:hypothetical protein
LSTYLYGRYWTRTDVDCLEVELLRVLFNLAQVSSEVDPASMSLNSWKEPIGASTNRADQKGWISSAVAARYCPVCLDRDSVPFFRLEWRLRFIPLCREHRVVLRDGCWSCGVSLPIARVIRKGRSMTCPKCEADLSQGPITRPRGCGHAANFVETLEKIPDSESLGAWGWPESVPEFFGVLLLLMRYFGLHLTREPSLDTIQRSAGIVVHPPYDWRVNSGLALLFLEEALRVMSDWPENIRVFMLAHSARFIHLKAEYGRRFPPLLEKYMNDAYFTNAKHHSPSSIPRVRLDKEDELGRVKKAVGIMAKHDSRFSVRRLSRGVKIGTGRLSNELRFKAEIDKGRKKLAAKRLKEARVAIETLRRRGVPVSINSVACYLGRSDSFVTKSPEIFSLLETS